LLGPIQKNLTAAVHVTHLLQLLLLGTSGWEGCGVSGHIGCGLYLKFKICATGVSLAHVLYAAELV